MLFCENLQALEALGTEEEEANNNVDMSSLIYEFLVAYCCVQDWHLVGINIKHIKFL